MKPHFFRWGFWWRPLGGRGICIERDRVALFSERNGYRKVYRFGRWSLEWLEAIEHGR